MNKPDSQHPVSQQGLKAVWGIAIIVLSTVVAMAVDWRAPGLSLSARDALMRARGTMTPSDEITIVAIDEASIRRFGRFPWPRSVMAEALGKVSAAHPKAIALSVLFSDPTTEADDAALSLAIKQAGNVVVAAQLIETPLRRAEWLRPLPMLEQASAGVGHGNVLTDFDGVARALTLREADDEGNTLWSLAAQTVRVGDGIGGEEVHEVPEAVKLGARVIPVESAAATLLLSSGEPGAETLRASRMTIDFLGPAGSFAEKTVSIADLIDGRVAPETLRGRYVLIGVTAAAMGDRLASPFARFAGNDGNQHGSLMPGVEVLANAVTTILHSRFYKPAPDWVAALFAALIAATVIGGMTLAQGSFEPLRQAGLFACLAALILLSSYLAFAQWRISPPLIPMITALLLATPLTLLRRSLLASGSLDARIAELREAGIKQLPVKLEDADAAATAHWLPRGMEAKANALASLQTQLLARTRLVDLALQSVEDGLIIADAQGRIAFANPRAAQIFDLPQETLLGTSLFDRLNRLEHGAATIDEARLNHLVQNTFSRLLIDRAAIERELVVGASQPRYYQLRVAPVFAETAPQTDLLGFVATFADITKQRELHQTQNDVMALVTHEMKTPLTAIKGMSEVLMQFDPGPERRREMHQTISEAAQRLTRMIDEYLDLTRLESGTRQPRFVPVRVAALCEQNLLMLGPLAAQRGIRLTRRFAPDLPAIFADPDLLSRALTNLCANAIKYSPPNTEVSVSAASDGKSVFLSVADQGAGIPPEHRTRIFEKFYRIPRIEDADTPGTGLGLALVREIAELHQGRVTVESVAGTGSTFILKLPIKSDDGKVSPH
ncbi:MAG TPA: CHASE2 domain-containing protein [Blastocatellia bacterium]